MKMCKLSRSMLIFGLSLTASAFAVVPTNFMVPSVISGLGNNDVQATRQRFTDAFPGGSLIDVRGQLRRVFGRAFSSGNSPHESAESFLQQWSTLWGVPFEQLEAVGPFEDGAHQLGLMYDENGENPSYTAVYWRQQVRGVPVFRSYVWGMTTNDENFSMVLGGGTLKELGAEFPATLAGRDLSTSSMDAAVYAREALNQFASPPIMTSPRYVVWAGIDTDAQTARLAIEFTATGGGPWDPSNHRKMLYVVDAADGSMLHQESLILHGAVTGTVSAKVTDGFKADACNAEVLKGMPYSSVTVGGALNYADANGLFSATYTGTASTTVAANLAGKYFRVSDAGGNALATAASQSVANGGAASFTFNNTPTELQTAQVNMFVEANAVRDKVLSANANYPSIATELSFTLNSNIADVCNAYYDGNSLNFFQAGGGCNNTAFSTVIHHEYGHNVINRGGSGQAAYGEGMADCISILMSDDSQLGIGFFSGNCTSGIRNASNNCKYDSANCSSCGSEIHSCGKLLSGCVWDVRNGLWAAYPANYRAKLANLVVNSVPLHAGQSDISSDIAADFLTLDDAVNNGGNGIIADGTPNYNIISESFNRHGLISPSIALLLIEFPNTLPTSIDPAGTQTYDLTIRPVSSQILSGSQKMYFREGSTGAFTAYPLQSLGGTSYRATFPSTTCKSNAQFYFQASSTGGTAITNPSTAPTVVLSTTSEISSSIVLQDDFEGTNTNFYSLGNIGVSKGAFIRTVTSTSNSCNGPNTRPGSTKCYVTGSITGACNDIDGGYTELFSPIFDGRGAETLVLNITTYLSNDQGANPGEDPLTISISQDSGLHWVVVDQIFQSHNWTDRSYHIENLVVPSDSMQLKVRAEDQGVGDSQVKAAVDNVSFESVVCSAAPFGDLDGDRIVGPGDLAVLLLDFGPCNPGVPCTSDLDGSGDVDNGDLAVLLLSFSS